MRNKTVFLYVRQSSHFSSVIEKFVPTPQIVSKLSNRGKTLVWAQFTQLQIVCGALDRIKPIYA